MNFGYKLRKLREEKRITAKELADHLAIDLATLNRIENNKIKSIKPQLLINISDYLKVSISDLFEQEIALAPPPRFPKAKKLFQFPKFTNCTFNY
jgi:transcriptional regulator with XRE-family HTH domain